MSESPNDARHLPLAEINPWPGNPRKVFPEESIQALAESIKVQGIIVPLLVRANPAGANVTLKSKGEAPRQEEAACGWQIADGERRYRAAKLAGFEKAPCIVRELTDQEMYEISLVSEGQREDLTPLDRHDGIQKLVELLKGNVEETGRRLGRSASSVRAILRLKLLPSEAADALAAGDISLSVAELIAARPCPDLREKVAAQALQRQNRWGAPDPKGERPSYRALKEWIAKHCMVELKQSPFPTGKADLTSAGACSACPKRTGNNREEYPEGRADVCTDPVCYRFKVKTWALAVAAQAQLEGHTVLTPEEGAKLFPHDERMSLHAPYFDLKDQCWEDKGKKTPRSYKQLLEAHLEPADLVVCFDRAGLAHKLVKKDVALPLLQKHHGLCKHADVSGRNGHGSAADAKEQAKRRLESAVARLADQKILAAAAAQGEAWGQGLSGLTPEVLALLAGLVARLLRTVDSERSAQVCKRRGLKLSTRFENDKALDAQARGYHGPELLGLLAELLTASSCLGYSPVGDGKAVAALLKVNRAAAEKEARAELAGKAKGETEAKPRPAEPKVAATKRGRKKGAATAAS